MGGPYRSSAILTTSIARTTPAQKPRGLSRKIFLSIPLLGTKGLRGIECGWLYYNAPARGAVADGCATWKWSIRRSAGRMRESQRGGTSGGAATVRKGLAGAWGTGFRLPTDFSRLLRERSSGGTIAASMTILDINEIRAILPHRYPLLLVDRIVEMEPERVVGIKNVTLNEPFFTGHFPDFPVMPGVLIVEAMAQTAGVLVLKSMPDRQNKLVLLVAIDYVRFRRPVVPGDTLRMEMTIVKRKASVAKIAGRATVDGQLVAEIEVMCKLADKEEKQPETTA